MSRLFLDSANIDEIRDALRCGVVTGITTNPSLLAKEDAGAGDAKGFDLYIQHLQKVVKAIEEHSILDVTPLSVEVVTLDPSQMLEQANYIRQFCASNAVELYIKIPFLFDTIRTIGEVRAAGFRVNATAIMTALQAKMAAESGATVVSFFYRRMIDGLISDGFSEDDAEHLAGLHVENYMKKFSKPQRIGKTITSYFERSEVPVICGSIRSVKDVWNCWEAGADVVTAPMKVIREMVEHPKTQEAIERFQKDIEAWMK